MKVYSLTGKSGTGKSFQAMNLCRELNIESIIDDGLFIHHDKIMAGTSAKREKTKVGAIKAAMFIRPEHAKEVAASIAETAPDSVLVIATSDRMAEEIVEKLGLPEISKVIHIEDITTEREREKAFKQRRVQGKHVIPVPSLQLKRDFAGYFMNPLKILKTSGVFGVGQYTEKTVVRPAYSYKGEFFISDKVISDIAGIVADDSDGIKRLDSVYANTMPGSLKIEADVTVRGDSSKGTVWERAADYQKRLTEAVETITAFNVVEVNVTVVAASPY